MARMIIFMGLIGLMTVFASSENETGILDCVYETDSLECAKRATDAAMDQMEFEVSGRKSTIGLSKIFEGSADLLHDGVEIVFGMDQDEDAGAKDESGRELGKELFGKKKKKKAKKWLKKLIPFLMLIKAKISLILQMISTHLQFKFFILAVAGFIINATRLWLDIKKGHVPAKVIVHEHAQHQHHYDDDSGYWRRSAENFEHDPQESAYSAWAPER